jgi:hypothetical protein
VNTGFPSTPGALAHAVSGVLDDIAAPAKSSTAIQVSPAARKNSSALAAAAARSLASSLPNITQIRVSMVRVASSNFIDHASSECRAGRLG